MTLDRTRTRILLATGAIFVVMGLFPPWVRTYSGQEKPAGYALIVSPPEPEYRDEAFGVRLDFARLMVQWLMLAAVTGGLLLLSREPHSKLLSALRFQINTTVVRSNYEPIHNRSVAALVDCLYDPRPAVREQAVCELARSGSVAREALPHIRELRRDPVHAVRARAAWAKEQIEAECRRQA